MTDAVDPPLEQAVALVDLAAKAATAYGRPDLLERLDQTKAWLVDPRVRVLVVGEFKQGKSSLVNAILGLEVCPIDDDVATAVPTVVQWAPELAAVAVGRHHPGEPIRREPVTVDVLPGVVTEEGNPGNRLDLALVEIGLPSSLLEAGLALVDTPGVGGLGSIHSALTVATLPLADGVVFVSDAASELTRSELAFLETVAALCPRTLVVTSKIDLHPEWRKIHELDGIHLADAGLPLEQLAVSAAIRELAIEGNDREANEESGFPALIRWLREAVADDAWWFDAAGAAEVVGEVARQLHDQFTAERSVLQQPGGAAALLAELERAEAEADRAKQAAARWQQVLADGFADASSAIDRDLRGRLRDLSTRSDDAIEALDPSTGWAEFEPWLYEQVARSIGEHLVVRHDRLAGWIGLVAGAFGEEAGDAAGQGLLIDADPTELLLGAGRDATLDVPRVGLAAQALSLLRGSYGAMAMFGALGGVAGLVLSTPATVGIGLLLGGKGLREEKTRQLAQRRAQGKVAARQYLEAVTYALNNEQRDTLRISQRAVRDHFAARATELHRSTAAALEAARAAQRTDASARVQRLGFVDGELAKIAVVAQRAEALRVEATEPGAVP
jgi:hypothetical protein